MTSTTDRAVLLEAFKQQLLAEDTSQNTISAYLSDLAHFITWYTQVFEEFALAV